MNMITAGFSTDRAVSWNTPAMEHGAISPDPGNPTRLSMVCYRTLSGECLARSLAMGGGRFSISLFQGIGEWLSFGDSREDAEAILYEVGPRGVAECKADFETLTKAAKDIPVIAVSGNPEITEIVKALNYGLAGYVPASLGIEVCAEAIKLAIAGGRFIPLASPEEIAKAISSMTSGQDGGKGALAGFTERQRQVIEAMRQGKANKIIAYELEMAESTVKVHIRSIMRKLKATNRTEVCYKLGELGAMSH